MRKLGIGRIKGIIPLLFFLCPLVMTGQTDDKTKQKILEIKLNDEFIFGEGVSDNKEIAYGVALEDLLMFANELKEENSQDKLVLSDLITNVETIVYEEGSRFEVIVYIPFKIVIDTNRKPSLSKEEVITAGRLLAESSSKEAVAGQEEIIVPANEETVITEQEETIAQPNEEPIIIEQEETVVPVKEEPLISKTEEIKSQPLSSDTFNENEVEAFLTTQDNFSEIKSFLSEMKGKGKISETGALDSSSAMPEDASLIIMDEYGGILAVLSPQSPQGRTNYKTHKKDSENNYNGKFILWYRK